MHDNEELFRDLQRRGSVQFVDPEVERKRNRRDVFILSVVGVGCGIAALVQVDSWFFAGFCAFVGVALTYAGLEASRSEG